MSDEDVDVPDESAEVEGPEPVSEPDSARTGSARAGTPAAAAASRARRIGGRAPTARREGGRGSDAAPAGAAPAGAAPVESGQADAPPRPAGKDDTADHGVRLTKTRRDRTRTGPSAAGSEASRTGGNGSPGSRAGRRTTLIRWAPAAVLTAALVVLAVLVAVSTHGSRWDRPSPGSTRDHVLAAAKSCVVATNTYSYDKLDAFERKGLACATGSFAGQFKASVEKILKKQAPTVKQKQSLQVNTAGIVDVSHSNQWDVLIYGQISVTNTSTTTARLDPFGAVVHLKQVGGDWRISSLCSQSLGGTTDACY